MVHLIYFTSSNPDEPGVLSARSPAAHRPRCGGSCSCSWSGLQILRSRPASQASGNTRLDTWGLWESSKGFGCLGAPAEGILIEVLEAEACQSLTKNPKPGSLLHGMGSWDCMSTSKVGEAISSVCRRYMQPTQYP